MLAGRQRLPLHSTRSGPTPGLMSTVGSSAMNSMAIINIAVDRRGSLTLSAPNPDLGGWQNF